MARSMTRQKNFGMAKAVKKSSPTQKSPKQTKINQSNGRQMTTRNQKLNSIPKTRSTQSILKRELAQNNNNATNHRSVHNNATNVAGNQSQKSRLDQNKKAPKNSGGMSGRKTTKIAVESVSNTNSLENIICGQANTKTDELRKPKEEPKSFEQSNPRGSKSPSLFESSKIKKMYEGLNFEQKPDSTVLSSDSLVNAFNNVVIKSSTDQQCQRSPDLFETDSMDGYACSDNLERLQSEKVEMVSAGVQCKLSLENKTDAQVGTDDNRVKIKMIDVGVQTSPLPVFQCVTCQTKSSDASCGGICGGGGDSIDDSEFVNFDAFDESNDEYGSDRYESDSSYDHCLDDFDCLEHLDEDDGSSNVKVQNSNEMECDRPQMNQIEPIVDGSPPRHQIYNNRQFFSPDKLGRRTTKNK